MSKLSAIAEPKALVQSCSAVLPPKLDFMDDERESQLHVSFFPFMSQGHIIPVIDMAKLFAMRGLKVSVITTPVNAPQFLKLKEKLESSGHKVDIQIIKFPCEEVGLPQGCESLDLASTFELKLKFFKATAALAQPLEQLLMQHKPHFLVADMFFPWSTDVASKFGIPRIVFNGTCFFSSSATECIRQHQPHKKVTSDTETFLIPNFPGEIKLTRKQLQPSLRLEDDFSKFYRACKDSELKSYGVLVNSFYELESVYADHFRKVLGRKSWHIGPLVLCNKNLDDKAKRGREASMDVHECLKWLDSKQPNSVLYVSFGSLLKSSASQRLEIAMALEESGQEFIWVVKKDENSGESEEQEMPEGYEDRMRKKGLIIQGWAPQLLVLEHEAVGGFVTHCGWNSALESITAGVPMVTWPVSAEQFTNEKLITEVLRVGVGVGAQEWSKFVVDGVKKEAIKKAVSHVMTGKEAEEMRSRSRKLAEMAKMAVQEGGSSHSDLSALIEDLRSHCLSTKTT